jgi:hypothetical protein
MVKPRQVENIKKNIEIEAICPQCGSDQILKIEPCALCKGRFYCRKDICTNSPYYISSKAFTQTLFCNSCGYQFSVTRRI